MRHRNLRVAFIHPDLGIGGAERLVVDAALGLQNLGHQVTIFTSHHDRDHCFEETKNGTLRVTAIDPPFPRAIAGKLHVFLAHLRQLHLLTHIITNNPHQYDVFFVDQLSTCVPILRTLTGRRVVFYCHFPDKLLADGAYVEERRHRNTSWLKRLYRIPMDLLEELTTKDADVILANSAFTARVVARHLPSLERDTKIVYPGINARAYLPSPNQQEESVYSPRPSFLSLNRFEQKKNVVLAIKAFSRFKQFNSSLWSVDSTEIPRLVLAGGYDPRVGDNVTTLNGVFEIIKELDLTFYINDASKIPNTADATDIKTAEVILILNFTSSERSALLNGPSTLALLYTPSNEHFGIGPVEGMICGLPIIACDSGGPTETVIDADLDPGIGTGWLRPPKQDAWALAMTRAVKLSKEEREKMAERGRKRAKDFFGMEAMSKGIEKALNEAVGMGIVRWGYGTRLFLWFVGGFIGYWVLIFGGVVKLQ